MVLIIHPFLSSSGGVVKTLLNFGHAGVNASKTRTTFETPKYPRQPRDQYTAQIVNTLEPSGPHQIEFKKNLSNLVKFQTTNTCTYVAAKNARTVKQSHCETV